MILDSNLSIKELSRLNKHHETKIIDTVIKSNLMVVFNYSEYSDNIKKSILRKVINKDNIKSVLDSIRLFKLKYKCKWTDLTTAKVFRFVFKDKKLKELLKQWMKDKTSYDLGDELLLDNTVALKLLKDLDIKLSRSRRSSKAHLQLKPIIEEILNSKTTSEYQVVINKKVFYIDEFYKNKNLCIEIDGKWCHNKEYDEFKDTYLTNHGYNVVRIPIYSNKEFIRSKLESYL